ncbi:MAG: hypothetical protein WD850_01990 [Candidatus Spechtbacterales bacterium]
MTTRTGKPARRRLAGCVHHWIIESPNGRESNGECKYCGETKQFVNSIESVMWEQTNTIRRTSRGGPRFSEAGEIKLAGED